MLKETNGPGKKSLYYSQMLKNQEILQKWTFMSCTYSNNLHNSRGKNLLKVQISEVKAVVEH